MGKILSRKKVEMTLNGPYLLEAVAQCFAEAIVGSEDFKDGKDFRVIVEAEPFVAKTFESLSLTNPFELHKAIERELNKLTKAKYEVSAISTLHSDWSEIYADAEVIKEK